MPAKKAEHQQIEVLPRGGIERYLLHGSNLGHRQRIARQQRLLDRLADAHGRNPRLRPNQDCGRFISIQERHVSVGNLRWRLVHDRRRIELQPFANVSDHSYNLGQASLVRWAQTGADEDALADRIRAGPEFALSGAWLITSSAIASLLPLEELHGKSRNSHERRSSSM